MVRRSEAGTTLLVLMVLLSILSIAVLIAMPVIETQKWREREEELLFRGRQYVEAVRLYAMKNPGGFPDSIEELVEDRFLRKAYADPMTKSGEWNIILLPELGDVGGETGPADLGERIGPEPDEEGPVEEGEAAQMVSVSKVMIVPQKLLSSVDNPRIIGVVSSSNRKSFFVYDENETYDAWLFYFGRQKGAKPEIIRFGAPTK